MSNKTNSANAPVKMTRNVALERLKEAEELLEVHRPQEVDLSKNIGVESERVGLWLFSVLVSSISFLVLPSAWIGYLGVIPGLGIMSTFGLVGVAFAFGMPFFQSRELSFFNNDKKIRKLLSHAFLGKYRQDILAQYLKATKENDQTMELYRLLVEKVTKELESSGVFEIINDFDNPLNTNFVTINQSTGSFKYTSRETIEEKREKERKEKLERKASETILEILSNKTQILGQGKDFKNMF